ncbi:MAG: hypothetical protein DWQ31_13045 [Planctomycetota bacterium]|nr:MAG: hypothetical protein DWQ31_13045 [Planctomycetota bacterium]REJ95247.1 MAG: hypothetical protein DWQ35_06835 [Planctomycetota bacterium]REK27021.1 MAG: hypothetical protein DWQ42_08150 [Planctomycetota bacterium]REK40320.1 MAG: hypothetical protein DWQ46_16740 [Planctomycetota bacterium]
MGRIGTFLFGAAVGGLTVYGSLQYHLLRADSGFHFVEKTTVTFKDAYVDVRDFGPQDWLARPALSAAVMRSGKGDLIQGAALEAVSESVQKFLAPQE